MSIAIVGRTSQMQPGYVQLIETYPCITSRIRHGGFWLWRKTDEYSRDMCPD